METRNYELMFIVNPELSNEDQDGVLQRVQRYLTTANAHVYSFKSWGLRRLAYTLKGYREGRYYLVQFATSSDTVNELDRDLRIVEGVLRHLITRMDDSQTPDTSSSEPVVAAEEPEAATAPEPAPEETEPTEVSETPEPSEEA